MTRYHRRRRPDRKETAAAVAVAAGVAVGVGAVTFYLTRIFLSRETMGDAPGGDGEPPDRGGASGEP